MSYCDGFVLPVPRANLDRYREQAELAALVWREHGALAYREWVGDDVPEGEVTSFPQAVQLQPDEVVIFAYVLYENRAHRDEVLAKVMADPRLKDTAMPFDARRMFWGGFSPLISA